MHHSLLTAAVGTTLLALTAAPGAAAAVTLPYSNDFSTEVADFTTSGAGSFSLDTGDETYDFSGGAANRGLSVVDVTGVGGATPQGFITTTTFSFSSNTGGSNTAIGLSLLGDDQTPTSYILADFTADAGLRVINIGGPGNGALINTTSATPDVSFALNTDYTLTATAAYSSATSLTIELEVSDGTNSNSFTTAAFDPSANYTGSAVGITARGGSTGGTQGTLNTSFDSFSVTPIPEPASALLIGLGSLCLLGGRRRHH